MNHDRYTEIHVERLPAMHVACCRAVSQSPEDDASATMDRWRAAHHLPEPCRHFGFDTEIPSSAAGFGLRGYEVWTTVPEDAVADETVTLTDVPGCSYATLRIEDPFDDPFRWIPEGWLTLHAWVDGNPWVRDTDRQWLEELVEHDGHRDLLLRQPVR